MFDGTLLEGFPVDEAFDDAKFITSYDEDADGNVCDNPKCGVCTLRALRRAGHVKDAELVVYGKFMYVLMTSKNIVAEPALFFSLGALLGVREKRRRLVLKDVEKLVDELKTKVITYIEALHTLATAKGFTLKEDSCPRTSGIVH